MKKPRKNIGLFTSGYPEGYEGRVNVGERDLKTGKSDAEMGCVQEAPG